MDEHGLPIVGAGVDYKKIPSLEHRNTLAMLNKFLAQTTSFLNRFSSVCEERLLDLSNRIQRLDISLNILEEKLKSIDGLDGIQANAQYEPPAALLSAGQDISPPQEQKQTQQIQSTSSTTGAGPPPPPSEGPIAPVQEPPKEAENVLKIKDDPRFTKFFRMKRLGVNPLQIAMEMKKDGHNPDLLEDEDAPAPKGSGGGGVKGVALDSSDSSDNSSSPSEDESDVSSSE